jgi:hypothetical protein
MFARTRRTALTLRSTSAPVVCQLQTDTRIQRLPRVVPPKKASPITAIRLSVSRLDYAHRQPAGCAGRL